MLSRRQHHMNNSMYSLESTWESTGSFRTKTCALLPPGSPVRQRPGQRACPPQQNIQQAPQRNHIVHPRIIFRSLSYFWPIFLFYFWPMLSPFWPIFSHLTDVVSFDKCYLILNQCCFIWLMLSYLTNVVSFLTNVFSFDWCLLIWPMLSHF